MGKERSRKYGVDMEELINKEDEESDMRRRNKLRGHHRAPNTAVGNEVVTLTDGGMWMEDSLVTAHQPLRPIRQVNQVFYSLSDSPDASRRKLLQTPGAAVPFPPLKVSSDGEPCVMFQARKLSLRYEKQRQLDLTERAFSPQKPVDTSQSACSLDKATLVMRFGDVDDLRGLSIRLQLSNTFYESSGQWWFSVDSVSLLYNASEEAVFNASEVYAPASSSYHCLHVSSLQRHSALLRPVTDHARRWAVTFTDFQIQAFNVTSGKFSPASDCATFLTPAILMGLVTSLILLLVLAYALHMVVHLKHIEHDNDEHKADVYSPHDPEQPEYCYVENNAEKNIL
ncbi:putative V-type proton ATPase subunit S1-like [Scophthalmus maximus]|uniref:Putative V-type proton ATPase subunit S1-like n=1 Tax=Scophthalmus maximus TaxID=52904 RepID=A0A2U9BEC7_SCOMX|nr:putative V-type proton ATPase subunit S1-like [Scophthalmus maximus]